MSTPGIPLVPVPFDGEDWIHGIGDPPPPSLDFGHFLESLVGFSGQSPQEVRIPSDLQHAALFQLITSHCG